MCKHINQSTINNWQWLASFSVLLLVFFLYFCWVCLYICTVCIANFPYTVYSTYRLPLPWLPGCLAGHTKHWRFVATTHKMHQILTVFKCISSFFKYFWWDHIRHLTQSNYMAYFRSIKRFSILISNKNFAKGTINQCNDWTLDKIKMERERDRERQRGNETHECGWIKTIVVLIVDCRWQLNQRKLLVVDLYPLCEIGWIKLHTKWWSQSVVRIRLLTFNPVMCNGMLRIDFNQTFA